MLSEVLDSDKFRDSKSPLTVALGVDLFGQPQVTDLRKMPHGLIAGLRVLENQSSSIVSWFRFCTKRTHNKLNCC